MRFQDFFSNMFWRAHDSYLCRRKLGNHAFSRIFFNCFFSNLTFFLPGTVETKLKLVLAVFTSFWRALYFLRKTGKPRVFTNIFQIFLAGKNNRQIELTLVFPQGVVWRQKLVPAFVIPMQ